MASIGSAHTIPSYTMLGSIGHVQSKMMDLIEAAKNGDISCLRRLHLATENVDINFRCPPDGTTALYWAACNGHVAACDWLIRHMAEVNLTTEKSGSTPLHGAADRGHTDCVRVLLKRGADVRLVTKSNGDTPLHLSAYRGHVDICRLLLEHGACAEVLNKQGRTPMQEAQIKSHYDIFQLISKFRSDSSRGRERSLRSLVSLRSWTCELDSTSRHSALLSDKMKMISEPSFSISSSSCCSNDNNVSPNTGHSDDEKDILSRRRRHHHDHHRDNHISNVLPWLDETFHLITDSVTSLIQPHLPPASTGHQSRRISTNNLDRKSSIVAPEVVHGSDKTDEKVTRREEVILSLVRRLSSLTFSILSLEVRMKDQDDLLAELTRENEVLTRTRGQYECAVHELEEERRLNVELRNQMRETERKLERMRSRGTMGDDRDVGQASDGST